MAASQGLDCRPATSGWFGRLEAVDARPSLWYAGAMVQMKVVASIIAIAGSLLLLSATARQGQEPVAPAKACNLGIVCGIGIPPNQLADGYIDYVVNSSSNEKCFCNTENAQGEVVPCEVDAETNCSFDISYALNIPTGTSIKFKGKCYGPGETGPDSGMEVSGSGCSSAFSISITVYNNETCTGTGTTMALSGACVATGETCKDRDC